MKTTENSSLVKIDKKKQEKLIRNYPRYLKSKQKALTRYFGAERTKHIIYRAEKAYPGIVTKVHAFNTPMYDALMVTASKMAALKKGMNALGISTKEFVKFSIKDARSTGEKVPSFLMKILGKVYLSKLMRKYLKKVGKSVTENGWPTEVID